MRISICKACRNNERGVHTRLSIPHTCTAVVDDLMKNELGPKRWKIRKRLIETDEKMRSKTVDRLIESMPKHIADQVDDYADKLIKRNKLIEKFDQIPNGAIIWIKHTNTAEWLLCEWKKVEDSTILGTARLLTGRARGIGYHKYLNNDQEFEDFIIVEKPFEKPFEK